METPQDRREELLEELVFQVLERCESGETGVVEELCRLHPEQSGELRRRIDSLRASGLVGSAAGAPNRLGEFELVRRLDGFADGHVGFPVLAWSAPAGGPIHVLSWVPDGTDAGTYRARSAVVSLTDDGTIAVRSRFVVLGLDVWLHYYGGHLQGDHLNVAELVHVDVEGRRSWNIIDVRLDVEGDGDELGWELLGERPVDGPESFVGFLPELDRALAIRQERVGGVVSGPPSVVSEALPSPIAGPPARLVEGESPTIVARDDSTLVLVTYSAVHAFALPAQELVAREEL
ncbi:MAG: hypothetical protein HUU28_13850, partial [Planctomycetaceae bacterium]|nr:hypothetical protein [Planctomycetaceae bacterium]